MSDIEDIMTMSEEEFEELPIEDKKKAINLQDLIYAKGYMNSLHNNHKDAMDDKYNEFTSNITAEHDYFKNDYNTTSAELAATYETNHNRLEADYQDFCERTNADMETWVSEKIASHVAETEEILDNIRSGPYLVYKSQDTIKVQGADFSADTATQVGDYIYRKEKLVWSGSVALSYDSETEKSWSLDVASAPKDLLNVFERNCRYRIVFDNTQYVLPNELELEVTTTITSDQYGANVIPFHCGSAFIVENALYADSTSLAVCYLDASITKDSSGNYSGSFYIRPTEYKSKKITTGSYILFNIRKVYKIVS